MKIVEMRPNGTKRVYTVNDGPDMTDQSFKDDADVNFIVKKYLKTGQITHLSQRIGRYMDVSELPDLQTALTTVHNAQAAFMELPAELRKEFDNDPVKLVSFLQDPANKEKAIELGLVEKPITPPGSESVPLKGTDPKPSESAAGKG